MKNLSYSNPVKLTRQHDAGDRALDLESDYPEYFTHKEVAKLRDFGQVT